MAQFHNRPALKARRRALRNRPTKAEAVLWRALKGSRLDGHKVRRQHSVGPFILDFYCPDRRVCIEVDGSVHDDPARAAYDADRQRWLERRGIAVVRVTNEEVLRELDVAVARIRAVLADPRRASEPDHPLSPSSSEEGGR